MSVERLRHITPIGVEKMGELADRLADPDVLRLENLDTDLRPPDSALAYTRHAIDEDDANSYLPFVGLDRTRQAAARRVSGASGQQYDWRSECLISAGGLSGLLNVLLATLEPGDEVLLTSPTYVGYINRVRLAGGVPRFVPLTPSPAGWRLDLDALADIDLRRLRMLLVMSPSMPSGAVLDAAEWQALARVCEAADCWLVHNTAMERILFDGREVIHPAGLPGMRNRVVTVGSVSKEYRMIGWRVGWVVGPAALIADVARVSISNVVCQTGIAMGAAAVALEDSDAGIAVCTGRWQGRRDVLLEELSGYAITPPHGGWSMLVDTRPLRMDAVQASQRLLEAGKVAATPMVDWGDADCARYLRLVYANEPVARLRGIRTRMRKAFGI